MQQIYLDNASTTFPKPQAVADAVYQYITHAGTNISRVPRDHYRGPCFCHSRAALPLFRRRGQQCCLYEEHYRKPEYHHQGTAAQRRPCACYRYGAQRRHASAPANRHRATTDNAPTDAITFSRIPCDADGALRLDALPQLLRPNTKAIIMTHASNVCGTLQPLAQSAASAKSIT